MWWYGLPPRKGFRCGLCGYRFRVGDTYRFVYMNGTEESHYGNFVTCVSCDGPQVVERRLAWEHEADTRFWSLTRG